METNISILIADDHLLVRQGFKRLLERQKNIELLDDEAVNGTEAISKTLELKPDILLLDINMPEMNGFEALSAIKNKDNSQKVIILTIHNTKEYISEAMNRGANGYISKDADISLLMDAITRVYNGENYIQPTIFKALMMSEGVDNNPLNTLIENDEKNINKAESEKENKEKESIITDLLTAREVEVLQLITEGKSNRDIAVSLDISEKTARNHLYKIFKKIDVADRTQAAIFAIEHNIKDIVL